MKAKLEDTHLVSGPALTEADITRAEYMMKNKDWEGWPKTEADIELLHLLRKIPVNELYPLILCVVPSEHRPSVLGALVDRHY